MRGFLYNKSAGANVRTRHFKPGLPGNVLMSFLRLPISLIAFLGLTAGFTMAQDATPAAAKPQDRLIGEITIVDAAGKKITVKDDATKTEYSSFRCATPRHSCACLPARKT